jgi:hypothetical protein
MTALGYMTKKYVKIKSICTHAIKPNQHITEVERKHLVAFLLFVVLTLSDTWEAD